MFNPFSHVALSQTVDPKLVNPARMNMDGLGTSEPTRASPAGASLGDQGKPNVGSQSTDMMASDFNGEKSLGDVPVDSRKRTVHFAAEDGGQQRQDHMEGIMGARKTLEETSTEQALGEGGSGDKMRLAALVEGKQQEGAEMVVDSGSTAPSGSGEGRVNVPDNGIKLTASQKDNLVSARLDLSA